MSFHQLPHSIQESLSKRSLLKVISGLNNFDKESVKKVARTAGIGGADLLDIACEPELVHLALENSGLPVCVSSVQPKLFPAAVDAGAQLIEIGNYDSFYPQGRIFEADEILALTSETRKLLPDIPLSVTVPHFLPLDQQALLALNLLDVGADLIQTEGGTSATPQHSGCLGLIEKAAPTIAAAHTIFQSFKNVGIEVPLICASGLSAVSAPMAISVGASGIGVGSAINRLKDEVAMVAAVRGLREALISSRHLITQSV